MAGNNEINMKLTLKAEGLGEANAAAKGINDNLGAASKAAERLARNTKTLGIIKGASAAPGELARENSEYGVQRSVKGTGAGARDFAQQAQGLGGLVHLYATFAANIFAVSAAFKALSDAADTTNMVKGLDQLGASAGKNLTYTAKKLVEASDGAISLKQGMEAVAKASTAGLSTDQIAKLGVVARNAATVLGRDIPDSFSRLTRGITKLEPELLDELGLFTKIGPATEVYARSLGKTASSLTDFERRQAFANAVLEEGAAKYGQVNIEANVYSKLLASISNTAQKSLEVVNAPLAGIIKYLSESPTALAATLGYIAALLVKQAIPAITAWREGLTKNALVAADTARSIANSYGDNWQTQMEKNFNLDELSGKAKTSLAALRTEVSAWKSKSGALTIQGLGSAEASRKQLAQLDKMIADRENKLFSVWAGDSKISDMQAKKLQAEFDQLKRIKAAYEEAALAKRTFNSASDSLQNEADKQPGYLSGESVRQRILDAAKAKANRLSILSEIGGNVQQFGYTSAIEKMNAQIADKGIKGFEKFRVAATGHLVAVATSAGMLVQSLSNVVMGIGLAIAAFQIFDAVASKNSKEAAIFSDALDGISSSLTTVKNNLAYIDKQGFEAAFSVDSIKSRASAFTELADAIGRTQIAFNNARDAASWWDNFKDGVADLFGAGDVDKLAKAVAGTINSALDNISNDVDRAELKAKLSGIIGSDLLDYKSINNAFSKAGEQGAGALAASVERVLKQTGIKASNEAAKISEAVAGFTSINKAYTDLSISLKDTSPIAKFSDQLIASSTRMMDSFDSTEQVLVTLMDLVNNPQNRAMFSKETQADIEAYSGQIATLNYRLGEYEKQIKESEKAKIALANTPSELVFEGVVVENPEYAKLLNIISLGETAKASKVKLNVEVESLKDKFKAIFDEPFSKGISLLTNGLVKALSEASLAYQSAIVSGLEGPGAAQAQAAIKQREISVQESSITAIYNLTKEIRENTALLNLQNLQERMKRTEGMTPEQYAALLKSYSDAVEQAKFISLGLKATAQDFKALSMESQRQLQGAFRETVDTNTKLAPLAGQRKIVDLNEAQGKLREAAAEDQRIRKAEIDRNNVLLERAKLYANFATAENFLAIKAKQSAEVEAARLTSLNERKAIEASIAATVDRIARLKEAGADAKTLEGAEKSLSSQRNQLAVQQAITNEKNIQLDLQQKIELVQANYQVQLRALEQSVKLAQLANELQNVRVEGMQQEIDFQSNIGAIDTITLANKTAINSALAQELSYSQQIAQAESEANKQRLEAAKNREAQLAIASVSSNPSAARAAAEKQYQDEIAKTNSELEARKQVIEATNSKVLQGVAFTRQSTVEAAKLQTVFEDLSGVLGDLGTKLGAFTEAIINANRSSALAKKDELDAQAKLYQANVDLLKLTESGKDPSAAIKAKQEAQDALTEAQNNSARVELSNNIKLLSSSKELFSKKTAGYKVLAAMEKVQHVQRMFAMATELAASLSGTATATAAAIAGTTAQGLATIPAIFGKFLATMGPWGWAAAAAAVAAIFGKSGPSGSIPKGFTAEEAQQVQGTGQSWNTKTGKLVENGTGVFGDPTEVTQSIKKSLELIEATSVEGLTFSSEMVKLLTSIDNGINAAAKGLINIPGLRNGTAFGTKEGTTGGSTLGWGSKTSTSIVDSGVKIAGTLAQLAAGLGSMLQYENSQVTTKSSSWFGLSSSTSTRAVTKTSDLTTSEDGAAIKNFFTQVFTDSVSLMKELAKSFGKTEDSIMSVLNNLSINAQASLKGLTGQAFVDALAGLVNGVLDKATSSLFGGIVDKYKKIGETSLQTVARVLDDNEKVNLSLKAMGASTVDAVLAAQNEAGSLIKNVTRQVQIGTKTIYSTVGTWKDAFTGMGGKLIDIIGKSGFFTQVPIYAEEIIATRKYTEQELKELSISITESLVEAAGGLENFLDQSKFFTDNFLTEAERLAPIQDAVSSKLAELGVVGIDSRKAFKDLVLSLDLTTESGRKMYQSLMDISESFAMVYPEVEKSLSAEEYRTKILSDQIDIERALGNVYKATIMQREEELAQLALYPEAQAKVLIANKKVLYALQDAMAATNQYVNILKAQGDTEEAIALQRKLELLGMDDRLRAGQEYIYALNDEADLVARLTKARDSERSALTSTIDTLEGYINNIRNFKQSLLQGSTSNLTTQQKYSQAKTEIDRLMSIVTRTPITNEDKRAQQQALSELTSMSDTFLQLSKELYSSSGQFNSDFATIMSILNSTTGALTGQKSTAELQLESLNLSTAFLDSINSNIETVADLLPKYFEAVANTDAAKLVYEASQAMSDALTIALTGAIGSKADTATAISQALQTEGVASLLAEIARNTAAASNNQYEMTREQVKADQEAIAKANETIIALNGVIKSLNTEITSLKTEVQGLRTDQQKQTQDIINNNAIAANNVAGSVRDSYSSLNGNWGWIQRIAVNLK